MMHVMVVVVPMMMVVMMVVMVLHRLGGHRRRPSRGGWRCFLRDGVSGEADGQSGRDDKAFDHGKNFLWLGEPQRVVGEHKVHCLNSI
jgi:hypothetical protein